MLFRTCPSCLATLHLWRIEPKRSAARVDTHFFECDRCGFATSEDIARIKQSDAGSGRNDSARFAERVCGLAGTT
jgi:hypothetical protein